MRSIIASLLLIMTGAAVAQGTLPVTSFPSVSQMQALGMASPLYPTVTVTGTRGGTFAWVSGSLPCNATTGGGDGGTTFCAGVPGAYVTTGYRQRLYGGTAVSVWWFEDTVGTADGPAFNAALATGKAVYCPTAIYNSAVNIVARTPYQRLYGDSWSDPSTGSSPNCTINFTLPSPGPGFSILPSVSFATSEHFLLDHVYLHGLANVTKLVQVEANWFHGDYISLQNDTPNSSVIWQEDENAPIGIYNFDMKISHFHIRGSAFTQASSDTSIGIRLGSNSQGFSLRDGEILNNKTHVWMNGANTGSNISDTTFQVSTDTGQAILIGAGSSPPVYNFAIRDSYCENCQKFVVADQVDLENFQLDNLTAARSSSASITGSAIFSTTANNACASINNSVTNTNASQYEAIFNFNFSDCIARTFVDTRGNSTGSGVEYAVGTYADDAFSTRATNPSLLNPIVVSGSVTSRGIGRIEVAPNSDVQFPVFWDSHETAEKICTYYNPTGGAGMTATFYSIDTALPTPSPVTIGSTGAQTTAGLKCISIKNFGTPNTQYYLEPVTTGLGTTNFFSPPTLYLRQ